MKPMNQITTSAKTDSANLKKELKKRHEFFLAILEYLRDEGRKSKRDIIHYLVDLFHIRKDLMDIPKKNGRSLYANRMAWALFDLHKTGMIQIVDHGVYEITTRGIEVSHLDLKQLKREISGRLADEHKFIVLAKAPHRSDQTSIEG